MKKLTGVNTRSADVKFAVDVGIATYNACTAHPPGVTRNNTIMEPRLRSDQIKGPVTLIPTEFLRRNCGVIVVKL